MALFTSSNRSGWPKCVHREKKPSPSLGNSRRAGGRHPLSHSASRSSSVCVGLREPATKRVAVSRVFPVPRLRRDLSASSTRLVSGPCTWQFSSLLQRPWLLSTLDSSLRSGCFSSSPISPPSSGGLPSWGGVRRTVRGAAASFASSSLLVLLPPCVRCIILSELRQHVLR